MKESVAIIEDDRLMRVTLEDALRSAGYEVFSFETGGDAMNALNINRFSVIVTDVRLPDIDGINILREISSRGDSQVIVMTAFGTIQDAVEAMKLGAFDYITKPFSLEEFLLLIERAINVKRLREENIRLKQDLNRCYSFPNIIGSSPQMKAVFSLIEKLSGSDSTVLILGESGTGKELIATTIHYQSKRKSGPLIKVNCAALPEGLIEAELFGHERGAFTGAIKRKQGRFELANGGTIFLDEVGDIPLSTQAKLLRVIQERTFERVGGTETFKVDVRLIAATNKDLQKEVKNGTFREDLYYRLNVIPLTIPPLRERKEDIPDLVEFFLRRFNKRLSKDVRLSREAMELLLEYDYPGNVRELENIVERLVTLSQGDVIKKEDLSLPFTTIPSRGYPSLSEITIKAERDYIIRILKLTAGNRTRAAEMLGISRKTLWEKIHTYGIEI